MRHLFTYGTLMSPDIMHAVAGCRRDGEPALLSGFRRYAVKGADYPAIIESPEAEISGRLYRNLPSFAWQRLDRFEGNMYARLTRAVLAEDGSEILAEVYVLKPAYRHCLTADDWDFDRFTATARQRYLQELGRPG